MTETFDAVLAEMEEIAQYAAIHYPEADDALHDRIMQAKARLAAAHAAEVGERDDLMAAARLLAVDRAEFRIRAEKAEARAEAAERDARELRQDFADLYAAVPSLPITPATCDAATDVLTALCMVIGNRGIEVPPAIDACMGEKGDA